jgi:sodium transport system permease protein
MNRKNVRLVFLREVRDQIRDRRTLFMIVVLPLLLYPGLMIGAAQISFLIKDQPRTIVVLNADDLPADPPLLHDNHFDSRWFSLPDEVDKLRVIHDGRGKPGADSSAQEKVDAEVNVALLEEGRDLAAKAHEFEDLQKRQETAKKDQNTTEVERLTDRMRSFKEELAERFSASKIQVLIVVPKGLKQEVERINRALADRGTGTAGNALERNKVRPLVVQNSADEKSAIAYQRLRLVLNAWEQKILQERLSEAKLPETLAKPVNPELLDVAIPSQVAANVWSKLFPTLLIIMAVTGAFYPAVDVAAGEKERGTMETLLISPARRSEIVLGKFFTVVTFSISTVLLNLLSMGLTGKYVMSVPNEALSRMGAGSLSFPGPWELMWLILLLLPLSAFYSAISLALATFARSTKEGQYYLTPILLVTLGLTMFCLSPVAEIDPFYSILPVVGPALLLKEVLASPGSSAPLIYGIPVLATSVAYSLAGLWWAITMFNREDVLFREAERFDLRLWIRHLLRDKDPTPSFLEGGLCFVFLMLLQFVAYRFLHNGVIVIDGRIDPESTLKLLLIQQLVFIGSPVLFMGIMLTSNVWRTFRLRLPNWRYLIVGCVLPFAVGPLSVALQAWLQTWFFPPLQKQVVDLMQSLGDPSLPLWLIVLAMAVAPGICEELAFRGFVLSGFVRSARPGVAIALSAVAFGVFHIIPQQVFNATLMGLILGLLAIRSKSLLPGVLFHILYNSIEMIRTRAGESFVRTPVLKWFVVSETAGIGYSALCLYVAGVVAALLIGWLVFGGRNEKTVVKAGDDWEEDDSLSRSRKPKPAIPTRSLN